AWRARVTRGADPLPERERLLGERRARRRTVTHLARERDARTEATLVPDGDGVPTRGLADDAPVRSGLLRAIARALARRRLLFDRADHRDLQSIDRSRRGAHERREWSFRIDCSATDELAVLDAHRDLPRHRIDVTEEDDMTRAIADLADRVARV